MCLGEAQRAGCVFVDRSEERVERKKEDINVIFTDNNKEAGALSCYFHSSNFST